MHHAEVQATSPWRRDIAKYPFRLSNCPEDMARRERLRWLNDLKIFSIHLIFAFSLKHHGILV
eukprot:m.112799 g.112799  ORF g.112799 m.112799 type:complete len:63 (+) comp14103_c1_seq2:884-1072(+)